MNPSANIIKLLNAGFTETAIAAAAGTNQSTINRIKHGGQPGFELGLRISRLRDRDVTRAQKRPEVA